jgi:hypothetical protein
MLDWIERRVLRQRELQQGADADLLRDNRKRWKLSWVLLGSSFVLIGVQTMIVLSDPFHRIAVALTMILFVAGALLGHWARAEKSFLDQPDPKEPPNLFK